jgi:hypothetical protein
VNQARGKGYTGQPICAFLSAAVSATRKKIIRYSILVGAVLVLAVFALPVFTTASFVDPLMRQTSLLKVLARALLEHASHNDGRFPARLEDLVHDSLPAGYLKFHDLRTKEPFDWIYFEGHSTSDPRGTILVASPKTFSKADGTRMVGAGAFRLILSTDGRTALLTEKDYQACIAEQKQPGWSSREETKEPWQFLSRFRESKPATIRRFETREPVSQQETAPPDEFTVTSLIKQLEEGRSSAAKAIGVIGPPARNAIPSLSASVANGEPWTIKCAAIALGRFGHEAREAVPALSAQFEGGKYPIDAARALWKIDPAQGTQLVPKLVALIEEQRNENEPNNYMDYDFFSTVELLGEIGPEARAAIPILRVNLKGGAKAHAAWALWRIDPSLSEWLTPIIAEELNRSHQPDRIDRMAQGSGLARFVLDSQRETFDLRFGFRLAATGALWQMHPDKRSELNPLIVVSLREWNAEEWPRELPPEARAAVPALETIEKISADPEIRSRAQAALRRIAAADYGHW